MLTEVRQTLDPVVAALHGLLGPELFSCCAYGSAVRGNWIPGVSDINLLVVLGDSAHEKHADLARLLQSHPRIDPFLVPGREFSRTARAFATKFQSIQRHYVLLHGEDMLAGLRFENSLERFLCEQALRNFRLRLIQAFVLRHRTKRYSRFLTENATPLFVHLSEALRLEGIDVPKDFPERIAPIERHFNADGAVLRDLLNLKTSARALPEADEIAFHQRLFVFTDKILAWIETHWPMPALPA